MHLSRRRLLQASAAALSLAPLAATAGTPPLLFVSNSLADYLHLLFYRVQPDQIAPFIEPGFDAAPQMEELIAAPEAVASAGLTRYDEVAPFLAQTFAALPARRVGKPQPRILSYSDTPPTLAAVQGVIAGGAGFFDRFWPYWRQEVQPKAEAQIDAWREQDATAQPLAKLLELHRLPLRADSLQVVAMPFHPAGSANYSPPAVYTGLFKKPDLAWTLGHEASHLIWSQALGADWTQHPHAAQAAKAAARQDIDLEEAMCLFMQAQLSKACGFRPADYSLAARMDDGAMKRLQAALEADWHAYRRNSKRWPNLIDYVTQVGGKALV